MSSIFGYNYSDLYDLLYTDKPYDQEVAAVESMIYKYMQCDSFTGKGKKCNILDAGCGTGNHSVILSKDDQYLLTGLDLSADMLNKARKKIPGMYFVQDNIKSFLLPTRFDVVITMGAVLGYQLTNRDVMSAFECARNHLNCGGLYIFDVWYGPTVLHTGVGERIKEVTDGNKKFLRLSKGSLFPNTNVCHVKYRIWCDDGNEFSEDHYMRYFFPLELQSMLESKSFRLLQIGQCPNINVEPNFDSWHMMVVAEAV